MHIQYGNGIAGLIGRRLAKKMGLPVAGSHQLVVDISHDKDGLHWYRSFNHRDAVKSIFKPVGKKPDGHWLEITGPLTMQLTVDINRGGWYWRCLNMKAFGVPLPMWLLPKTTAYKVIEDERYRFYVEFSLPIIGSLVCYSGLLDTVDT